VVAVHAGKGQVNHADRLKRSTSASGNGRWLFGEFVDDAPGQQALVREIRRQPANPYGGGAGAEVGGAPRGGAASEGGECGGNLFDHLFIFIQNKY
jgi:hypothetical protein